MMITIPKTVGTVEVYMDVMKAICGETTNKSMIDLCCCFAPHTPLLGFKHRDYIDIIDRKLDHPEEQKHFMKRDVLTINPEYEGVHYDVAICSDGIEHMLFEDGKKLLRIMTSLAEKRIIFTPSTDLFGMAEIEDGDPEAHRSLWSPEWFREYGWNVVYFPNYHEVWNGGAFFAWSIKQGLPVEEYVRVNQILMTKPWVLH